MTLKPLHFTCAICIALFVSLTALAADTRIDATRSALTAVFTQEGVPVEVPFRRFSGAVVYNPANVAASSATLEVETGSLDIGDEAYNAEVRRRGWFDSARFAKATFCGRPPSSPGRQDCTRCCDMNAAILPSTMVAAARAPVPSVFTAAAQTFPGRLAYDDRVGLTASTLSQP